MWIYYLQTCTYTYNSFANPPLNELIPFQLTCGRPPKALLEIETILQEDYLNLPKNSMRC